MRLGVCYIVLLVEVHPRASENRPEGLKTLLRAPLTTVRNQRTVVNLQQILFIEILFNRRGSDRYIQWNILTANFLFR